MSPKKAQAWGVDIIVASVVFFITLFLFYQHYSNLASAESGDIDLLIQDSKTVSESLIEPGYPVDWNSTNVIRIGLTYDNQRLNETKLLYFSQIDYDESKKILNTKYDYLVFFYNHTGDIDSINGISNVGKPGVTPDNVYTQENPDKLVDISRFLIYESEIYRMVLYIWY